MLNHPFAKHYPELKRHRYVRPGDIAPDWLRLFGSIFIALALSWLLLHTFPTIVAAMHERQWL